MKSLSFTIRLFGRESLHSLLLLLSQEQVKATLQRDALTRPLVIGGEARRVRRLGDLAVGDLLQGVEAVAVGVEGVHQMHGGLFDL